MADAEVAFLVRYLFDDPEGHAMVARIDRRVDRLPNQEGLGLLTKALEQYRQIPVTFAAAPRLPVAA